jgi:hypothetical protein
MLNRGLKRVAPCDWGLATHVRRSKSSRRLTLVNVWPLSMQLLAQLLVWMGLDGERLANCQDLEEKREVVGSIVLADFVAQQIGVLVQMIQQRRVILHQLRRQRRVRPQPELQWRSRRVRSKGSTAPRRTACSHRPGSHPRPWRSAPPCSRWLWRPAPRSVPSFELSSVRTHSYCCALPAMGKTAAMSKARALQMARSRLDASVVEVGEQA